MKKSSLIKTTLALLLSVSLVGLMFTGCKPNPAPESNSFTVTFDSDGGTEVAAQTVKEGACAERPEAPSKEGYNFYDWYAPDSETAFDFATPITADITLKAKWLAKTYTVTFDSDGGSDVAPAIVKYGEKVTKPTDPVKTDFIFSGWYNGETEFNFDTAISSDLTLKAKWVSADSAAVVTIKIGETKVKDVTIEKGGKVAKPEITSEILTAIEKTDMKGYVTWTFDFSSTISENTEIVGTWHDVSGYVNTNPFQTVDAADYSGFYLIPIDPAKAAADWASVNIKAKCLALDGTVVTAAYSQAQAIAAKATTDWSSTNKIAEAYNLGATADAASIAIPNSADSVSAIVIQRSNTDLDKIAYIEVTEITWTERSVNQIPELTSTGYVNFADIPGYPADFDPDNYEQIWITVQLLDENDVSIVANHETDCTEDNFNYAKVCLNDTNNETALSGQFGPGYGDGFGPNYLNNTYWKFMSGTDLVLQFAASDYTTKDGYESMNCVSVQLDGSLKKVKFISFGGNLKS